MLCKPKGGMKRRHIYRLRIWQQTRHDQDYTLSESRGDEFETTDHYEATTYNYRCGFFVFFQEKLPRFVEQMRKLCL